MIAPEGPPDLAPAVRRQLFQVFRVTAEEKAELKRLAEHRGQNPTFWFRSILKRELREFYAEIVRERRIQKQAERIQRQASSVDGSTEPTS